ncbi:hypothetical protein F5Y06DRAFT_305028 [Hypoxylon sp. FL0890]|nr:hypothetical protein F5Y06DRAFT_305028 [Hypoxylon sp. FL0890]
MASSNQQPAETDNIYGADPQWQPPQYVNPREVEVTPDYDQVWTPTFSEFSLPAAFLQAHSTNATQGSSSPAQGSNPRTPTPPPSDQDKGKKKGKGEDKSKTKKKAKNDGCTLDEFWYEEGKEWKVQMSKEEARKNRQTKKGLAGCETAPECHTCGNHLDIEEILNSGPCRVCCCFN